MWDETPLDLEGLKSWLQARLGQSIDVHIVTVHTPTVAPSQPGALARTPQGACGERGQDVGIEPCPPRAYVARASSEDGLAASPAATRRRGGPPGPASPLRL